MEDLGKYSFKTLSQDNEPKFEKINILTVSFLLQLRITVAALLLSQCFLENGPMTVLIALSNP